MDTVSQRDKLHRCRVAILCLPVRNGIRKELDVPSCAGVVVGLELLVSLAFIIAKLAVGNYTDIWLFALGSILRAALFNIALLLIRAKSHHTEEE